MERVDRPQVAVFFAPEPFAAGAQAILGEDAAHHMRVRRMQTGQAVRLVGGAGQVGEGRLVRLAKSQAVIDVERVEQVAALPPVHLLVPIGDRDRMLWLAEKSTELGATDWRPVLFRRSRSVSPRGEGATFQAKVHARMASALEQSEGGWLPTPYPEATVERAIAATPVDATRLLLDPDGAPIGAVPLAAPVAIALGPEGGLEREERDRFVEAGFAPVALAGNILRFETAGVVALGIVRALLAAAPSPATPPETDDGR